MNAKKLISLAAVCATAAFLAPNAMQAFSGRLDIKVGSITENGGKARDVTLYVKGEQMRTDFTPPPGSRGEKFGAVAIILDKAKHMVTVLLPEKHTYATRPSGREVADQMSENLTRLEYKATGKTETIAGIETAQYAGWEVGDGTYHDLWVTPDVGKYLEKNRGMGKSSDPGDLTQQSLWTQFAYKDNFLILRATIRAPKTNEETFHFEVVKVDRTPPPDSMFQVPEGFKKVDMPHNLPDPLSSSGYVEED